MPSYDRGVKQPAAAISHAVQQLVECRRGERVRGQARVRLTDRTVDLPSVKPNDTFSRRHDVLPSFSIWVCKCRRASVAVDVDADWMDHALPDAGPSAGRPELDEGEEHRE